MNSIVRVGDGDGLYGEQWNLSGDCRVYIDLRDLNPRPQEEEKIMKNICVVYNVLTHDA